MIARGLASDLRSNREVSASGSSSVVRRGDQPSHVLKHDTVTSGPRLSWLRCIVCRLRWRRPISEPRKRLRAPTRALVGARLIPEDGARYPHRAANARVNETLIHAIGRRRPPPLARALLHGLDRFRTETIRSATAWATAYCRDARRLPAVRASDPVERPGGDEWLLVTGL